MLIFYTCFYFIIFIYPTVTLYLTHLDMLRKLPQSRPGEAPVTSATSGGFGILSKPFKKPTPLGSTRQLALPGRKRKAVSYKEDGDGGGDDKDGYTDTDGGEGSRKKMKGTFEMGNKIYGDDGVLGDMAKWCNRKFPVFEKKDKITVFAKGSVRQSQSQANKRSPKDRERGADDQVLNTSNDQPQNISPNNTFPLARLLRGETTSHPYPSSTLRSDGRPRYRSLRPHHR